MSVSFGRPGCCHRCESRTVKPHCEKNEGCTWVRCVKCGAVSGYVTRLIDSKPAPPRAHFGGEERYGKSSD
jgi:hypothetical protein